MAALISSAEALVVIRAGGSHPTTAPSDLDSFIESASDVALSLVGPVQYEVKTATFDGGGTSLVLPDVRVAVSSVVVDGVTLAATSYTVDTAAGVIHSEVGGFTAGIQNHVVTYTVGDAAIPELLKMIVKEQLLYLWQTSRQGTNREVGYTPTGYGIPWKVTELARAYSAVYGATAPGFA